MKLTEDRPYADPEAAARKLMEMTRSVETIQDGRIYIAEVKEPFLSEHEGAPAEYDAGLKLAIERGWLHLHESGTFIRLTNAGASWSHEVANGSALKSTTPTKRNMIAWRR